MTEFSMNYLINLIREICEQDELAEVELSESNADKSFDEIGLDSLALLSTIAKLEQQTGVQIGMGTVTSDVTLNELYELVQNNLGNEEKAA